MILRKFLHYHPLQKAITKQILYITNRKLNRDEFIQRYLNQLLEYQATMDIEDYPRLPFVMIGSRVSFIGTKLGIWSQASVCYPENEQEELGQFSFTSPNGRNLLLAKVNDVLPLDTERGEVQIRIRSIEMADWERNESAPEP